MGKRKEKWKPWQLALAGLAVSLGVYGGLIGLLAYAVVTGMIPTSAVMVLLTLSACVSVLLGGVCFGRQLPIGIMAGCLSIFAGFWAVLLIVAWICYGGVMWSSTALPLLLSSLAGAVFSGVLSRKQKGRRITKRFG